MYSILNFLMFKTIEWNKDKMVEVKYKKNQSKLDFYNCLFGNLQKSNLLHSSCPIVFFWQLTLI